MVRRKVNYKVIYEGEGSMDLETGKVYECVAEVYEDSGELHDLAIVDESEEDYLYDPADFKKIK